MTAEAVMIAGQTHTGSPTAIAVVIDIADKYHINPDPPRSGPTWFPGQYPTTLKLIDPPAGVQVGQVQYPEPKPYAVEYADQDILVYEGQVVLYVPLLLSPEVEAGTLDFKLELEVQACDPKVCLMPEVIELSTSIEVLPVGTELAESDQATQDLFAGFDPAGWAAIGEPLDVPEPTQVIEDNSAEPSDQSMPSGWLALFLFQKLAVALAAGFILNFTPCVLPVVPLKVMSLAQHGNAAGGRKRTILLALVMASGIIGFWLVIGGAMVVFKQFDTISKLFQNPEFNLAVGVVIAVLAVSMLGVFTINLPRAVYQINPTGDTVTGSFGFGIMTAVLATPCAGPLMGAAVAWATLQGVVTVLLVFAALGLGMALPYLLLTLFPELVNKMPRAGAGSELLKQTMGILMLAAAAFFLGVGIVALTSDGTQANSQLHWWFVGALVAAAGIWLILRGVTKVCQTSGGRRFVSVSGLLLIASGVWLGAANAWPDTARGSAAGDELLDEGIPWIYYTPDRLAEQQDAGRVVLLDFTAEWCLNCKALEKAVLESDRITALLREPGVAPVKVDITSRRNVDGNNLLKKMGRVTIPLLVVLDGQGNEVFKADFYTIDQVADAIERAKAWGEVAMR
ncbi:protein-disulfide reductase DsbD family protein [Algisphaera agarilytica]|uniref:Thiol:disulfide interchange protein DsbD n=1 Tax=Algisphaera agarilytica TaxID=1385975 RepID=A0A7X0H3F2_9BACT|nr:cytochrome c biogenesis protein CcdA [Algisphaera agarilytica]MBB6428353.1 thiol:disulfide interchange protein DsbD [Algisphaera agarilytica]